MQTTINERFKIICDFYNLNVNSFSKKINTSQPTVKAIFDGKTKPSYDTIVKVLNEFNINAEWLILDIGKMEAESIVKTINNESENTIQMLTMISALSAKNAILERELSELNQKLQYNIAAAPKEKYGK